MPFDDGSNLSPRAAYVPRDERDLALVRQVITLTVARWHDPSEGVSVSAFVREYIGDGLFALEVTRTDKSKFDLMSLVDNDEWQATETGAAWVQVDADGQVKVGIEMDHSDFAFPAEYGAPVLDLPRPSLPDDAELVGLAQVAAEFDVPYQTAVSARKAGKFAARRVGRDWATSRAAFGAWVRSR